MDDDYQDWWMAYEPEHPNADSCKRCGCEKFYDSGPTHSPFGLGIVVCYECHKNWSHVKKWLRCGYEEDGLEIPEAYEHHLQDINSADDLYDAERDSEGEWTDWGGD